MAQSAKRPRKRLRRFEIAEQPRFVTFSCYQRLPLLRNDRIKREFIKILNDVRGEMKFRLLAWVIMPEHVHLLIVPDLPNSPLKKALQETKRRFAERVLRRWKELQAPVLKRIRLSSGAHRFWQHGGGYDRNIRDDDERWEKIEYIHNNPVSRGLAAIPTEYFWSSARWYSGLGDDAILIVDGIG